MQKAKNEVKNEAKRDKTRAKVRGKRSKLRGKAVATAAVIFCALLMGCASATPSSKTQRSDSRNNTVTVTINVYTPAGATALAPAEMIPPVHISVADLIGTMVQSADAGGNESTTQSATPTNTSGIAGDKPIEELSSVGKAALTGGAATAVEVLTASP